MKPKRYSLQKRLIIYISLFSVVLGCVLIFAAYRIALEEINEVLDKQMQSLAERIAENRPEPLQSKIDLEKQYSEEDLFVDIWSYTHTTLHPQDVLVASVKKAGFYTHQTPYGTWLTYIIPGDQLQIQVSQQKNVRQELALELAANMFLPYVLFLPFAIFGLSWVIRRNFQPLNDFKTELASRKAQELKPIAMKDYPLELEPTIQEMNYLFGRISLSQQEQRQFVADSAHELRTPLTALNLQLQILLQQFPQSDALHNLSQGVLRMQHLVNQLLSLAKQEVTDGLTEPVQSLSLNQMTVACIEQLIQLALQKEIDLGVEQQQELLIHGQASALHSIIYNLIDNAIKYSPKDGVINVSIFQQGQQAVLQIEDSGTGIDTAQFNQIRQRFYRIHNYAEIGSGLGLSIVDKATERLGGTLEFSRSLNLGGLCVQVKFPLAKA
ncbi:MULTISPECIES: ATP-binding protein [Acinetobacter]|jgi:two-component system OmpR family sensor kinase/two-component system sensor histidine kinase QseC|uniref:ATP-binding protein n=1 Tax=Acinetobacter TaxID=469 RepID=UPI0011694A36|nr:MULTISPECIES: ATP-binding protein [unclassified Acinetobacter]MDD4853055.1 ATP-binding protein [Acinetobacter towneri]TQR71188.1 GHKL domain-containing protein [Acinetobacter sp. RF14B]TSH75864.1 GHKL domain-containing protein [Acinetobacter sp. RF15A]TSI17503.1 GHKL domain-containing protein [Acinetobacter sp. RF15B]